MPIEVRQITIRSLVGPEEKKPSSAALSERDWDAVKKEILSECRQMVLEMLRTERER
jgi:hypothetical protein